MWALHGSRLGPSSILQLALSLLLLLPALGAPETKVSLPALASSFWTPNGLKLPSKELVAAVQKAKLPCKDAWGNKRDIVLLAIASEFAFQRLFGVFLTSLTAISFPAKGGGTSTLAKHLVVNVMTTGSLDKCNTLSSPHGAQCVSFASDAFTSGNFDTHSNDFLGIGFTKTATILDGITMGVDVLFLDADQVLFRNPLPYLLARESEIMVSGDCHNHEDTVPGDRLPPGNNNIGFVYFRSTAMATRAVYNWAMWLYNVAHAGGKPWDQIYFGGAMEYVSLDVTVRHLGQVMLRPSNFPYYCMSPCGCDLRGVPYYHQGKLASQLPNATSGNYCDPVLMKEWYAFHFPCAGDMNDKSRLMEQYYGMYQRWVGPINSRSEPLALWE